MEIIICSLLFSIIIIFFIIKEIKSVKNWKKLKAERAAFIKRIRNGGRG